MEIPLTLEGSKGLLAYVLCLLACSLAANRRSLNQSRFTSDSGTEGKREWGSAEEEQGNNKADNATDTHIAIGGREMQQRRTV